MIASYLVRGKCSCSNESNAPCVKRWCPESWVNGTSERPYPFTVNSYFGIDVDAKVGDFRNSFDMLHVRGITTSAKDNGDFSFRINVTRCDKSPRCVVDQCCQLHRELLLGWRKNG